MKTIIFIYRENGCKPVIVEGYQGLRIAVALDYDGYDLYASGVDGEQHIFWSRNYKKLSKLKRRIHFWTHFIGNVYMPKSGKY